MNIQNDVIGLVLREKFTSCCARIVNQNKWPTLLHDRADVTVGYEIFLWEKYFEKHIVNISVRNIQPCSVKKIYGMEYKKTTLEMVA
jgi:hypothetical protein